MRRVAGGEVFCWMCPSFWPKLAPSFLRSSDQNAPPAPPINIFCCCGKKLTEVLPRPHRERQKALLATPEAKPCPKPSSRRCAPQGAGTPTASALAAQNAFRSVDSRDLGPEDLLLRMLEDLSARVTKLEALGGRPAPPAAAPEPAASAGLAFSMRPGGDFA